MAEGVVGSLRVNLSANVAEFREGLAGADRELRKFQRSADRTGKNLQSIGLKLSAGITAPLIIFARKSLETARDAAELQSAFDFSFGEMSDAMNDFAETTGNALGRSTQDLQKQAFTFNQLFKTALDPQQAAELSKQFTVLTNDLSSFFNVAEGDALTKLRSGLVGEAEPLRAFGVFLSAAAVESKALELGLGGVNGELSEQDKILARAQIILDQTKDAQGDLARTSTSFANRQRELGAELQEISVIIGNELIPPMTELIGHVLDAVHAFRSLDPQVQKNVVKYAALAAAIGPAILAFGTFVRFIGFAARGLTIFTTTAGVAGAASGKLRLNVLGLVGAFAGLAPVAAQAGTALGNFLNNQFDAGERLAIFKATLPEALGGLGVTEKEARAALERARAAQKKAADERRAEVVALRDGELDLQATQLAQLAATEAAAAAERKRAADQAKFLRENADAISRIQGAIDPVGEAFKEYNEQLAIAARAGLDVGAAQEALAQQFVDSLGGVDALKGKLEELPPAFRAVVEAARDAEIAEQFTKDFEDLQRQGRALTIEFDSEFALTTRIEELDRALNAGVISFDVYKAAVAEAQDQFNRFNGIVDPLDEVNRALDRTVENLADAIVNGRGLGDSFKNLGQEVLKILFIEPFLFRIRNALTGGPGGGGGLLGGLFGGGGLLSGLFGGGLAEGGPVTPGKAFVVGEQGPEVFVPSSAGTIVPNDQLRGGFGGGVTINQTIKAEDPNAFRASRRQIAREAKRGLAIS